jgi:hypothetical protein
LVGIHASYPENPADTTLRQRIRRNFDPDQIPLRGEPFLPRTMLYDLTSRCISLPSGALAMPPPAEPPERESAQGKRDGKTTRSSLELVRELAEALTVIDNYVAAAIRLDAADTRSARTKLREALEKTHAQRSRTDELFRQLRASVREKKGDANK